MGRRCAAAAAANGQTACLTRYAGTRVNSFQPTVQPIDCTVGGGVADRDRPSATSIETTTAIRAAIGIARLAYIMRVTSELLVVARAACGLCLKDTCMDERDDCERVGADLQ